MKRLIYSLLALALVLALLPAWTAKQAEAQQPQGQTRAQLIEGAKKEGKLVWWSYESPKNALAVINEFNKIYPFIKVEYWRGKGEETATQLEATYLTGRHTVDVWMGAGDPRNYYKWLREGRLEKYTHLIPRLEKWHKDNYDANGYWASAGGTIVTMGYNTKLVSPAEAPKNWEDLLDPKWKGQIGITRDVRVWWTLALSPGGWGMEKAIDFLTKLRAQKPLFVKGHSEGHALLVAGEFKINAEDYLHNYLSSYKQGAPVEWVRNRPVVITTSAFYFAKKAPHPNAAKLFIGWFFSPEGMKVWEDKTFRGSPFPGMGTIMSETLKGLPFAVRNVEVEKKAAEMDLDSKFLEVLAPQ